MIDEQIKKMKCVVCIYTQWNITQPSKKKEILPCATKCLELKGIILSETSKTQKEKHYMILYIEFKIVTLTETKNRSVVARSQGRRKWGDVG